MAKLAPGGGSTTAAQQLSDAIPLGHMGRRWDIAMACVFLARWALDSSSRRGCKVTQTLYRDLFLYACLRRGV
jgi:hypothetical protein